MKTMIIGGTGLLGYETAKLLSKDNHKIISFALPPKQKDFIVPKNMEIIYKNYLDLSDEELLEYMTDVKGLIFAAGIDERVEGSKPIYDLYYKYNIKPLERLLPLAKKAGIKSVVILGSYFTYFNRIWPKLKLTKHHPYIKSRYDQQQLAFSYYEKCFNIAVVEIPYVFGVQENREPVWTILVEQLLKMKKNTMWTKGGTALITKRQAAQAIKNALLLNHGANSYPIGYYNMEWKELIKLFNESLGFENKKIITVPNFLYKIYARYLMWQKKKQGIDMGLNLVKFASLQSKNQFIEYNEASKFLKVEEDNIYKEIENSIKLSKKVLDNRVENIIKMKSE